MWTCCCSKKPESKSRGPKLTGKNAQLLRELSDCGSAGLQDDAALDVGVVGKGYGDDSLAVDSPKASKAARNRRHSQRGLWYNVTVMLVFSSVSLCIAEMVDPVNADDSYCIFTHDVLMIPFKQACVHYTTSCLKISIFYY